MPAASQKVGKSLLKYLKPIIIGNPDRSTSTEKHTQKDQTGFKLIQLKPKTELPGLPSVQDIPPPKAGANWVEAVSYILALCKRATVKVTSKVAIPTYQKVMSTRVSQKIKFIGSIINTNLDQAEEKFFVQRLLKESELEKRRADARLQQELEEAAQKKKENQAA